MANLLKNVAPKLYMIEASPPVRSVLLTAEVLKIPLELIPVNLLRGDHLKPEYQKINPMHTVPTLDDNGVIICDSHAINIYLTTKYGKDDSLYPTDPVKRALVDQKLYFDSGILFARGVNITKPVILEGQRTVPPEKLAALIEAYGFLEKSLEGKKWAAGDDVTLADLSLIPSATSYSVIMPIEQNKFPNITAWIKRAEGWPYYHKNHEGLQLFNKVFLSKLKSKK